ncbi:MAG: glycosyltransferase, partial [Candidatus Hydrothermae bacterium]|nr:glycosyltransferase [Candidatus Hydrothermae bacterium]
MATLAAAMKGPLPVTVVIVNWNGGDLLLEVLAALEWQTRPPHAVGVMDNGSSDGSPERAAMRFPWVRLRRLGSNLGFAAANNLALREEVDTEWVALLNPDAV